jgi:light-harvesting complex II chlorophyll a/b binding protein 7
LAVQALADSPAGKQLLEDLRARRPELARAASAAAAARADARARSRWHGAARPRFLGPWSPPPPPWLDGALPGDYGFDPLALGSARAALDRAAELELLHARWAMLGALGALLPEALQRAGRAEFLEDVWWNVGRAKLLSGENLDYLGVSGLRVAGGAGIGVIAACQVLLMGGPEYARACGMEALEPLGLFLPGERDYPGSWLFDPLGLGNDAERAVDLRVKEIKHGRLAMVAFLGFIAQGGKAALVDGAVRGPLADAANAWAALAGGAGAEAGRPCVGGCLPFL